MKLHTKLFIVLMIQFAFLSTAYADSRDDFLAVLSKVTAGMSKPEVDKLFQHYMKGTNWPVGGSPATLLGTRRVTFEVDTSKKDQLTLKDCDVYRHSDDGKYDSDWGIICFKEGKVNWVDFAPD
jgi:hypothetical protein